MKSKVMVAAALAVVGVVAVGCQKHHEVRHHVAHHRHVAHRHHVTPKFCAADHSADQLNRLELHRLLSSS
jgi:hypothetical protein